MLDIFTILNQIDSVMYYPILIIVMVIAGLYFTIKTKGVQIRLFGESIRILLEPPSDGSNVSSLQAMLVSTASRVGTGNIIGVSPSYFFDEDASVSVSNVRATTVIGNANAAVTITAGEVSALKELLKEKERTIQILLAQTGTISGQKQ